MKLSEHRMELGLLGAMTLFAAATYCLSAALHPASTPREAPATMIMIDDAANGVMKASFSVPDPKHPEILLDHDTGCLYRKETQANRLAIMSDPTGKPLCHS